MRELITGHDFDGAAGQAAGRKIIVAGECALMRNGLTSQLSNCIQAWSIFVNIPTVMNPFLVWYFNPFAKDYFDTNVSPYSENIWIPTAERALVEYIIFHDYFDEGILIEGLQTYIYNMNDNLSPLYAEADKFHLRHSYIDYWIKEALDDDYTVG